MKKALNLKKVMSFALACMLSVGGALPTINNTSNETAVVSADVIGNNIPGNNQYTHICDIYDTNRTIKIQLNTRNGSSGNFVIGLRAYNSAGQCVESNVYYKTTGWNTYSYKLKSYYKYRVWVKCDRDATATVKWS